MNKYLIIPLVLFVFLSTSIVQADDSITKMSGRTFSYKVANDTYHIKLVFDSETQITWKYLAAPDGLTGKTSTETITRRDLRNDLLMMAWNETDGTRVIDILDLGNMKLFANIIMPDGRRYLSEATVSEHIHSKKDKSIGTDIIQQDISFMSHGDKIVGKLYKPKKNKQAPVVVILGPVAFVKEQAPSEYARRLAESGYAALIFDPRYHGESDGQPRRYESGDAKTQDVIAAINFAETRKDIDSRQVHLLGICQGVNWISRVAADDTRVTSVGLVAGHYLNNKVAEAYAGGTAGVKSRLAAAQRAKDNFEQTGKVEYIPIVSLTDKTALLTFKPVYDWYIPWANTSGTIQKAGKWENRITRMSELDIWGGDITKDLSRITIPTIMVHSNKAASGPEVPKEMFKIIPARNKTLIWFEDQHQTEFYDSPETIDRVVGHLAEKFNSPIKG